MDVDDRDVERACKRIRLQSPEPDIICDNFEDFLLSDSKLVPQLKCDNAFSPSILEPTAQNKDETRLNSVDEVQGEDTVRHVCLGTIILEATSSFFKDREESETPVDLRECGTIIKLNTVETGAYAGILKVSFPSDLLHRPSVRLSALLTAPALLRVIISSPIEEASQIGDQLSNNDLFLQHPSPHDIEYFELEMEYFNPHYLITPGSRMPQLEDLAIEYNESTSNSSLALDEKKKVFQAAYELHSSRRWCLTGTPIVNSIDNYGALLAFIQMKPLHAKDTFDRWISNPIRNSVQEGLRKLRILVEATCLRRTKSSISQALPPPTIREEKVDLHPYDRDLYDFFESEAARIAADPAKNSKTDREKKNVLSLILNLRRICDHGEDLLAALDTEAWRLHRSQGSNLQKMPGPNDSIGSYCQTSPSAKAKKLIHNIRLEQANNLEEAVTPPVKSVVFSYWTKMLDLVQKALLRAGLSCERIDGQSSIKQRDTALSRFANDPCCTVMLTTLGSGGEGIDLTSANHVHLLEPHWNPMAEEQAIARVHRIGQQRHVTATKYITADSIEEYVQSVQVKKIRLIRDTWGVNDDSTGNSIDDETSRKLEQWLAQRRSVRGV
nr:hypothetical protein FVER53263_03350 [Fusarium verticillioides]